MSEPLVSFLGGVFAAASIFLSQFEQQKIEDKIDAANAEIATLSRKIFDFTIGGDSYCHAGVAAGRLVFSNDTDFPLYDVRVRIVDLQSFRRMIEESRQRFGSEELEFTTVMRAGQNIELGNLAPNSAFISLIQVPLNNENVSLNLFYSARNGQWLQQIIAGRVGEKIQFAYRVTRNNEVLLETIPAEFPRGSDGRFEWEKSDRARSADV